MAKQKTQRIKAKVIDAVYVRGRGELCLHVEFPDSRRKTVSIHKDAFTCKHGDLDDEMEKTARMFIGEKDSWFCKLKLEDGSELSLSLLKHGDKFFILSEIYNRITKKKQEKEYSINELKNPELFFPGKKLKRIFNIRKR